MTSEGRRGLQLILAPEFTVLLAFLVGTDGRNGGERCLLTCCRELAGQRQHVNIHLSNLARSGAASRVNAWERQRTAESVYGRDMSATGVHARLLHSYFESARGLIDSEWYCGGAGHECFFQTEKANRFARRSAKVVWSELGATYFRYGLSTADLCHECLPSLEQSEAGSHLGPEYAQDPSPYSHKDGEGEGAGADEEEDMVVSGATLEASPACCDGALEQCEHCPARLLARAMTRAREWRRVVDAIWKGQQLALRCTNLLSSFLGAAASPDGSYSESSAVDVETRVIEVAIEEAKARQALTVSRAQAQEGTLRSPVLETQSWWDHRWPRSAATGMYMAKVNCDYVGRAGEVGAEEYGKCACTLTGLLPFYAVGAGVYCSGCAHTFGEAALMYGCLRCQFYLCLNCFSEGAPTTWRHGDCRIWLHREASYESRDTARALRKLQQRLGECPRETCASCGVGALCVPASDSDGDEERATQWYATHHALHDGVDAAVQAFKKAAGGEEPDTKEWMRLRLLKNFGELDEGAKEAVLSKLTSPEKTGASEWEELVELVTNAPESKFGEAYFLNAVGAPEWRPVRIMPRSKEEIGDSIFEEVVKSKARCIVRGGAEGWTQDERHEHIARVERRTEMKARDELFPPGGYVCSACPARGGECTASGENQPIRRWLNEIHPRLARYATAMVEVGCASGYAFISLVRQADCGCSDRGTPHQHRFWVKNDGFQEHPPAIRIRNARRAYAGVFHGLGPAMPESDLMEMLRATKLVGGSVRRHQAIPAWALTPSIVAARRAVKRASAVSETPPSGGAKEETSQGMKSMTAESVGGEEQAKASPTKAEVIRGETHIEEWLEEVHSPLRNTARSFSRAGYTSGGQVGSLLRRANGIFDQHTSSMVAVAGSKAPSDREVVMRARGELADLLGQVEPCLTMLEVLLLLKAGGAIAQEATLPFWVVTKAFLTRAKAVAQKTRLRRDLLNSEWHCGGESEARRGRGERTLVGPEESHARGRLSTSGGGAATRGDQPSEENVAERPTLRMLDPDEQVAARRAADLRRWEQLQVDLAARQSRRRAKKTKRGADGESNGQGDGGQPAKRTRRPGQAAAAVAAEAAAAARTAADAAGGDADECAARLVQWNIESGEAAPAEDPTWKATFSPLSPASDVNEEGGGDAEEAAESAAAIAAVHTELAEEAAAVAAVEAMKASDAEAKKGTSHAGAAGAKCPAGKGTGAGAGGAALMAAMSSCNERSQMQCMRVEALVAAHATRELTIDEERFILVQMVLPKQPRANEGDGNCLFIAFEQARASFMRCDMRDERGEAMRAELVDQQWARLAEYRRDDWPEDTLNMMWCTSGRGTAVNKIRRMRADKSQGGEMEITTFMRLYQVHVHIHRAFGAGYQVTTLKCEEAVNYPDVHLAFYRVRAKSSTRHYELLQEPVEKAEEEDKEGEPEGVSSEHQGGKSAHGAQATADREARQGEEKDGGETSDTSTEPFEKEGIRERVASMCNEGHWLGKCRPQIEKVTCAICEGEGHTQDVLGCPRCGFFICNQCHQQEQAEACMLYGSGRAAADRVPRLLNLLHDPRMREITDTHQGEAPHDLNRWAVPPWSNGKHRMVGSSAGLEEVSTEEVLRSIHPSLVRFAFHLREKGMTNAAEFVMASPNELVAALDGAAMPHRLQYQLCRSFYPCVGAQWLVVSDPLYLGGVAMRGDQEVDVHSPIILEPLLRAERRLQEGSRDQDSIEAQDHKVLRVRLVGRLEFLRLAILAKGHLAVRADAIDVRVLQKEASPTVHLMPVEELVEHAVDALLTIRKSAELHTIFIVCSEDYNRATCIYAMMLAGLGVVTCLDEAEALASKHRAKAKVSGGWRRTLDRIVKAVGQHLKGGSVHELSQKSRTQPEPEGEVTTERVRTAATMIAGSVGGTERTLAAKRWCFKRTVVLRKQRDCEGKVKSLRTERCGCRTSGCTTMRVTLRSTYWESDPRAGEAEGSEACAGRAILHPIPQAPMLEPEAGNLVPGAVVTTWVAGATLMRHEATAPAKEDLANGTYLCAERGLQTEDAWAMFTDPQDERRIVVLFARDNTLQSLVLHQLRLAYYWQGVKLPMRALCPRSQRVLTTPPLPTSDPGTGRLLGEAEARALQTTLGLTTGPLPEGTTVTTDNLVGWVKRLEEGRKSGALPKTGLQVAKGSTVTRLRLASLVAVAPQPRRLSRHVLRTVGGRQPWGAEPEGILLSRAESWARAEGHQSGEPGARGGEDDEAKSGDEDERDPRIEPNEHTPEVSVPVGTQDFDWNQYYLLNPEEDCPVDWMHDDDCEGCAQCVDIAVDLYERQGARSALAAAQSVREKKRQVARSALAAAQSVREADTSVGTLSTALADLFSAAPDGLHRASSLSSPPTVPQASVSKPSSVGTGAGAVDEGHEQTRADYEQKAWGCGAGLVSGQEVDAGEEWWCGVCAHINWTPNGEDVLCAKCMPSSAEAWSEEYTDEQWAEWGREQELKASIDEEKEVTPSCREAHPLRGAGAETEAEQDRDHGRGVRKYAVAVGRDTGIFSSWAEVRPLVTGFSGALHKSFASRSEAANWLASKRDEGTRGSAGPSDSTKSDEQRRREQRKHERVKKKRRARGAAKREECEEKKVESAFLALQIQKASNQRREAADAAEEGVRLALPRRTEAELEMTQLCEILESSEDGDEAYSGKRLRNLLSLLEAPGPHSHGDCRAMLEAVKEAESICLWAGNYYQLQPEISHFYHLVRGHTQDMVSEKAKARRSRNRRRSRPKAKAPESPKVAEEREIVQPGDGGADGAGLSTVGTVPTVRTMVLWKPRSSAVGTVSTNDSTKHVSKAAAGAPASAPQDSRAQARLCALTVGALPRRLLLCASLSGNSAIQVYPRVDPASTSTTTATDEVELRCVTGGTEGEEAVRDEASRAMVVWEAAARGCADKFLSPIETAAMLAAWAVEGKRQKRQKVASCDITYVHQQDAEFNMVIALQGKGGEAVTGCNFLYERASLGHATETMLLRCERGEQLLEVEVQYTRDGIIANPAALDEAMGVIGQAHAQLPEGKILVVAVKLKGWGKEGHSYLHRTVLLFDTDEALYYDPTSLVRGEYIRVQCEGFLPYLEREMDEWNLRLRATRGEADACRQGQSTSDASMCNLLSAVAVAAAALSGLAGALSVLRCLQGLGPEVLPDVARYGLPEIWDSAHRDGQRGAESEGTLTPHSLFDSDVFDRFNEQTRRARRRIVRSLEMKGDEPRSMRVADRDFAVTYDGYTTVYHNAGQGYVTVPHRGVDKLNGLILEGGEPTRLIEWEYDDKREKWTHCVDPQGRYVAMDVTTRGVGTTVASWGSSTVGDLWNQVFCGRTTLKAAIAKAKKSTDLTKGEATHVLGGKSQAEACARHHSFGKPVQCLSVPLKARVVGFGFDFAGIGVEIDAANDCCLATGLKMRSVYVSEIDPALRRVLVDNLAQDAFDAPLIGELAGFADGSTTASRVLVLYASPPCPQHKNDSNGVVTGHGVADTRDGMVALAASLARGQPAFLILENVPGTELQEGTIFLRGVAEMCGGGAVTVERRCVDLGVPVSGGRVFTVFLNAVTVKYQAEMVEALGTTERKVRPLLCEWWKDEKLSEKLKDPQEAGAAPYVRKIFPKHAWSTGRDDAPTKVGELLKNERHYANIYDGEGLGALFKRPTRVANRLKGLGAYLFEGEIYIPTVRGAARYMGIKWNRLEGLDTRERLLALGNTVPTRLSSSVLRPVLLTLKRHPDIEGECENLAEQPPHVRDVVETHHVRINQPSYVAAYPLCGHSEVDTYEGPALPRLSVSGVGGAGLTLRAMEATGLFRVRSFVTLDEAGAKAVLGKGVEIIKPLSAHDICANVVVGGMRDMTPETTSTWERAMQGDWLVLQIRFLGKEGSERKEVRAWMQHLCESKGDNCKLDLTELHTGGFNDSVLAQVTVATYTMGVVAAKKGAAITAVGLGTCGALISHLLSPGAVIQSAPRGQKLLARAVQPCKEARQKPLVHAHTADGKEVIDTSGPIDYPCDALIGDARLERRDSGQVCVRRLYVKERLSLAGIVDEGEVGEILGLRTAQRGGDEWLGEFLALETPPITNRALALRLYQHLVPQAQESAKRMMHGEESVTKGGSKDLRAVQGEECVIERVELPGWDVISLERDRFFSVGRRMLCVAAGTVVQVVGDRRGVLEEDVDGDAGATGVGLF